jgi:hypothetical protein
VSTRTPLPWNTAGIANPLTDPRVNLWGPTPRGMQSGTLVAKELTPADARLVLCAVNSHDALVDVIQSWLGHIGRRCGCSSRSLEGHRCWESNHIQRAIAALELAGEKP